MPVVAKYMWIQGFIGAICMPSELMPAWMPLSTIIRNGGPAYGGRSGLVCTPPARNCHPVSERPPPIALKRSIHSCVMPGTCAITQRLSPTMPGNSVFTVSNAVISSSKSGGALVRDARRPSECTSARQPALATFRAASRKRPGTAVPWAMNSPMPPVRTRSSPKNGKAFFSRCTSSGVASSVSMCRKLMRNRTRPLPCS